MDNVLKDVNMITCGMYNCYVIRGLSGDILIDTGTTEFRDEIETWLYNYNVKIIVLTHGHVDHIQNAAYFAKLFGAKIAMNAYDVNLARNNTVHKLYKMGIRGIVVDTFSKKMMTAKSDPFNVDIYLENDMEIGTEYGISVQILMLDGHTRGSVGVLYNGDFYVGDALMNFTSPSVTHICESPKAAMRSLDKIRFNRPRRIFFGHGKPIITCGNPQYKKLFLRTIF